MSSTSPLQRQWEWSAIKTCDHLLFQGNMVCPQWEVILFWGQNLCRMALFLRNVPCDRMFPYLAPRDFTQPSSLQNRGPAAVLSSAGLSLQQLPPPSFCWREEKETAFAIMFSWLLLLVSLVPSSLQLVGKCLLLASCEGSHESASTLLAFLGGCGSVVLPICTLLIWGWGTS